MLATAGNTVKLWNTENYSLYQEIPSASGRIIGMTWNQDGQCIAGLGESGEEIILSAINAKSAAAIGVIRGVDSPSCIKFASRSPHYLGIGTKDGNVAIWNVKSQTQRKIFTVTDSGISKISFSHNDSHIAAASQKGALFLLSVVNNSSAGPYKVFDNKAVTDLVYSRAKKSLLGLCSEEGSVSLFDSHASKVIHSFKGAHAAPAACVTFSPVNELLMISVGYDKKFACYNVQTKQPLMTHRSSAPLTSAAFLGGGQQVALGTMTGQVFVHDLRTLRTPVATISAHNKAISTIILRPAVRSASESSVKKNSRQKNNMEVPTTRPYKSSKSSSDQPSENSQVNATVKTQASLSPSSVDRDDILSPDVFSPIRSTENPVQINLEQIKTKVSKDQHSSRESLGMDDVLSPVRPTRAPQVDFSPTRSVLSHNVDDDIFSPVREATGSTGLVKNISMQERYRGHECEDDLFSPVRHGCHSSHSSPSMPHIIVSNHESLEEPTPNSKFENGKENQQPSGLGQIHKNVADQEKTSSTSVLAIHNQARDTKIMSNTVTQKSDTKIVHEPKTMPSMETLDLLGKSQDVQLRTTETQQKPNSEKMNAEVTTPHRYKYSRFSPPQKRALIDPEKFKELSSAQSSVDLQNQLVCATKPHSEDKVGESTTVLQVDLVRNCMAEVLEEFQDDVNRRLMHLQCVMIKQFLKQQKVMGQLLQQYSLNEDLLLENEKLRQEIKHLKANY